MSGPKLTRAQRQMLIDSEPDDITGAEGAGVELATGAAFAVAKSLARRGLGYVEGPGGPLPGMYFNSAEGLKARATLQPQEGKE